MALALSGLAAHAEDAGLWQPQVRAIIGANSNSGFSALEGFLPIKQNLESVLFLDVRSKYDFDAGFGQDVGLGIRRIVNPDLMIGGYAYLNVQNSDSHQFVATTLGLEAITSKYDAHVNVYLPISSDRSSAGQESSLSLVGNQLLEEISAIDHRTYAAWGIEGEVGVQAPIDLPENQSLRFDIGAYHFADPDGDDRSVTGAKAGIEYTFGDVVGKGTSLTFTGEVRNDNRDNTQFAGSVRLTVPFNVPGSSTGDETDPVSTVSPGLRKRLNERVRGDIGVRLQDQDKVTGTTTRLAINAATNAAFGKFFFADGGNSLGLGTVGDPTTLDDAVTKAGAGGFIVALGGSGNITTGGANLAAGQTVVGGGGSVQARLADGSVGTYNFGGSNGTIQGTTASPVITLANNNTLSNITITGGGDGIFGNNVTGTTLTDVTVDGAGGHGADFTGDSTNVKASGFTARNNGIDGLHIVGNGTYNFTGTTLLEKNADDGLDITGQGTYNFATLNALDNHDAGITVKGTGGNITITGGQVSGNKALGDDGVSVFIDPITAHIVLDSISQDGGTSGVVLENLSGSFTVNGATNISNTTGPAIEIADSPATIRFGDINITNPGTDGMVFDGVNASVIAGNIVISGLGSGAGLDFSNSTTIFTAQSLNVTGTGGLTSIGIDLVQTNGGLITITNGGTISNVGTGVRLGIAGSPADSADTEFTFGGGSIGGNLASLDARGLNSGLGLYDFRTTTFSGAQLFDQTHLIFIGASAAGTGDGSSIDNRTTIDVADADTDGAAIFVLVNRGVIDDANGFTLEEGQTLASFGNGRTFSLGGLPMNVIGANVDHGSTISDGAGAATLTNTGTGDAVTLANNTSLMDFNIAGVANGNGIHGNGVTGVALTGMNVSGASLDGVLLEGNSGVSGSDLSSTGNGGAGLSIQGNVTSDFTGTTTLSNNTGHGLLINGNADVSFETLNATGNGGSGVNASAGSLSVTGGTISGNTVSAFEATNVGLGVTLDSVSQTGGTIGIHLSGVSGNFTVSGTTTISNTTAEGIVVGVSSATVGLNAVTIKDTAGSNVVLNANTGAITMTSGSLSRTGNVDVVSILGGSATINIGATISHSGAGGSAVEIDNTSGDITLSGDVTANGGAALFRVGESTGINAGTITLSGSLSATGGFGGVVESLASTAAFNATGGLSVTNSVGNGLLVGNVAGTATFGAVTVSNSAAEGILVSGNSGTVSFGAVTVSGAGGNGIDIANNSGSVTVTGTTGVTMGSAGNTAGINFSGTNNDVTFGTTTVSNVGANQTGIDFSGSSTTADFGVTTITGTGDLTSRGIDLSSTTGNKTITFLRGSSISNAGVGVELSSSQGTATSANANFTFGDGDATVLQSSITAAAGGYTVNTIGLDPTLGNYNFNDVTFTGPAHLASAVGGVIMVSQTGGVIQKGTDGLSADVTTVTAAEADAMTGTLSFAFVGTVDLSGTAFTLDSGQSIVGFGNGTSILTSGTVQPVNVQGKLGATGGDVTGDEGVVKSTGGDAVQLLGNNQVQNTAFDFTGGSGSVFLIDQNAANFSNAGGIFIDGVTVSNVAAGQTAFKVVDVDTNVSINNNNINVAGTLLDANGGSGDITMTRGNLPNSGPAGTLAGGSVSIAGRTGGTVAFTGVDITANGTTAFSATGGGTVKVTSGTINATNAQAVALDGITADINFTSTSATFSAGNGIDLQNLTGTASFGTGTLTNTGSGAAFNVGSATDLSGGNAVISYGGDIISNGDGAAVSIQELTGGSVTLSGNLTDNINADAGGNIVVTGIDNGTAATVTFSGSTKQISSGATDGVSLGIVGNYPNGAAAPNTDGTINFSNGGLAIKTTTGTGFVAAYGGTVTVSGTGPVTGNTIDSGSNGLVIGFADVGSAGVTFDSIKAVSALPAFVGDPGGAAVTVLGSNLAGDVNIGGLRDTGYLGASLSALSGTGAVNFTGTIDLDVAYAGFDIGGPQITTVNIANVAGSTLTIDGGQYGIIQTSQGGTINVGVNGSASITNTTLAALSLGGGNDLAFTTMTYKGSVTIGAGAVISATGDGTRLNMSGSVNSTTSSTAFDFFGHADGIYNIASTIDHSGGTGVSIGGSANGTVTFSGTSKIFNTGANDAIVKASAYQPDPQTKGTLNFTNGGLVITTTSGAGFTASTFGTGTISVTGTGNSITTGTGTALKLGDATAVVPGATGATVGTDGITFDTISANGATTGISLNDVSGGILSLGGVDLEGITSRGVDISGTLGSALGFTSLKVGLNATNAVGFDLNGAALGTSNITAGDFDVDGGSFAGTIGIDMAGTTGTGTIQLGDTVNNNPAGQTSTIANVGYGVQFSSTTNAKLVFGDGAGPAESSIATTGGQVIHATDSLPTSGDYNFNDVNFTGDTSNLASIHVYYVDLDGNTSGTGDGSLANPGSLAQAQASTANVVVLIDKNVNGSQETLDLSGGTFNLDDGQVLLAFKSGDAAVDVSQLGVDTSSGASAAFHFTTVQNSPIIAAPSGIDSLRPVLQSNNATSVINFATSGTSPFTGGIENLIVRNLGTGAGVAVNATGASSLFLRDNDIAAGGAVLSLGTTGGTADMLQLSIDGNTFQRTSAGAAVSLNGQNLSATTNSILLNSFAGNTVLGGTGGGVLFSNVHFSGAAGGTLTVGNTGARVQGDGLSFVNPIGTLNFTTLNVANNAGTGILVNTKGAGTTFSLNNTGGTVDTTGGTALNLDPLTVGMTFGSVTATGGASGIIFDDVAGTFTVTGATTVTGTSGFGIDAINTNTGTFNFNSVTVNNTATTGGGIHVATGTLNVSGLANIDTTSGFGVYQQGGSTSFTGGLTIDTTSGYGFLAVNAGSVTVTGTGNTIHTATGPVLSLQIATIGASGMKFDSLTATGTTSGPGIQIATVSGGAFDGGNVSIAGATNAITVQQNTSSTVNFASATISGASGRGIDIINNVTGTVTFGTVTISNTNNSAVHVQDTSGTVNINGGTITSNANAIGVEIVNGAGTVNIAASVNKTTAGKIVDISGVTGGSVTLSGALSTGGTNDNGIYVHGNTGSGTFNFNGAMTLSTGANTAVDLDTNVGATMNFAGGMGITTGTGIGFRAVGGGTINVTGTNTITTLGGQFVAWNGVTIGGSGATFSTMTANALIATGDGVNLTNVGGGTFNGGTLSALSGTNSNGIFLSGTSAAVNFAKVTIKNQSGSATGGGIRIDNNTGAVTISDSTSAIGGPGAFSVVQGIGIDINGGSGNITIAASVSKGGVANNVVQISGRTAGTVTLSGTLSTNGDVDNGINVNNNTGGTIIFSGANSTLTTVTNTAVSLTNNTGATINFTGGGLAIGTTSGTGFNATGGGTINVTGANNTIQTSSGQILNWNGVAVGASGVTFASLQSTASVAADPINLTNVSGGTFNGGAVTVAGTSAGGDGIEINGSSATFNFASATISGTAGNGILLSGANGAVTFTTVTIDNTTLAGIRIDNNTNAVNVNGGSIGATNDPTGVGVDINGGTGAVNIAATVTKTTAGNVVQVSGRTAGTVAFSGNLSATGGVANGIDVSGNSGTAIINFSGATKTLTTGANTAINLTSNTGATVNFTGGGLAINTTTATGFNATGGGTVTVQGTGNTITSTTGTALNIANTTIGAANVTFQSITTTTSSANAGIVLDTTGSSGGLKVTGTGTTAGSGGTISNKTGADILNGSDASGQTTSGTNGTGIFLRGTSNVSLANMQLNDFTNFAVYGNNVTNFTMTGTTINGANGSNNAGDREEASVRFDNLLGTSSITNSSISGGYWGNVALFNTSGTLTRLTMDNIQFGLINAANGNTNVSGQVFNSATANYTLNNSTFAGTRADFIAFLANNNSTMDAVVRSNTFHNGQAIIPGGGSAIDIRSGSGGFSSAATTTFDISHNILTDGGANAFDTVGIFVAKGEDNGTMVGTIASNQIGPSKTNSNSDGIFVRVAGNGTMTTLIQNNTVTGAGNVGIHLQNNDGSATLNASVFGNTVSSPTSTVPFSAFMVDNGGTATDTSTTNIVLGSGTGGTGTKNTFNHSSLYAADITLNNNFAGTTLNLSRNGSAAGTILGIVQDDNNGGITAVNTSGGSNVPTPVNTLPVLPPPVAP